MIYCYDHKGKSVTFTGPGVCLKLNVIGIPKKDCDRIAAALQKAYEAGEALDSERSHLRPGLGRSESE